MKRRKTRAKNGTWLEQSVSAQLLHYFRPDDVDLIVAVPDSVDIAKRRLRDWPYIERWQFPSYHYGPVSLLELDE